MSVWDEGCDFWSAPGFMAQVGPFPVTATVLEVVISTDYYSSYYALW